MSTVQEIAQELLTLNFTEKQCVDLKEFIDVLKMEPVTKEKRSRDIEEEEKKFNEYCKNNNIKCKFSNRHTIPNWKIARANCESKYYLSRFDRLWDGSVNCECDEEYCECPEPALYYIENQAFTY